MDDEKFLITGAKKIEVSSEDNVADTTEAGIHEVDFSKKIILRSYIEAVPDYRIHMPCYSLSFRSSTLVDNILYTCTHSEIIEFDVNKFTVRKRLSHRLFNDLHHVTLINGKIFFASTGIDHIGELCSNSEIRLSPVLNKGDYKPIKDNIDYRIVSTKPHLSHPNHVFQINDELWTTRFVQKDAVCISDFNKRMDISVEKPHDGLIKDGRIYFSTVNGMIVVFDSHTLKKICVYDIASHYGKFSPGWCRGVKIMGSFAYVGFSALRKTTVKDNLVFLAKKMLSTEKIIGALPARLVKYDMRSQKIVDEMIFNDNEVSIVFSII